MDKNTITGFALIALVLIGFSWWNRPSEAELIEAARQDSIAQVEMAKAMEKAAEIEAQAAVDTAEVDSSMAFFNNMSGEGKEITLQNELVAITLNTKGGTVEKATLKNYKNQQGKDVTLLSPQDGHLSLALAAKNENIVSDDLYFEAKEQTDNSVTLQATTANGGTLAFKYFLRPDSYMLDFIIESEGLQNLFAPSMNTMDLSWSNRACSRTKI